MQDLLILEKNCINTLFGGDYNLSQNEFDGEEWERFYNATTECMTCKEQFSNASGMGRFPCFDHCTQTYIGAIHQKCQEERKRRFRIPVFFHNFRGYDAHLIIWGLSVKTGAKVNIIGQGMERYLVLQWSDHIEFNDSHQFINSSLATQTQNLLKCGVVNFSLLRKIFPDDNEFKLLLRNGVYPYD